MTSKTVMAAKEYHPSGVKSECVRRGRRKNTKAMHVQAMMGDKTRRT
jgi:hypothetical protein